MNNDAEVDVVCASEYAIQKLLKQNLLLPLEKNQNMDTINPEIYGRTGNKFGPEFEKYFVPYMYGTLGILYNADIMEENGIDVEELGWGLLWNKSDNPVLDGKILMKDSIRDTFAAGVPFLQRLASAAEVHIGESFDVPGAVSIVTGAATIKIPMDALVDKAAELARLEREYNNVKKQLDGVMARLSNPAFTDKAPEAVVNGAREQAVAMQEKLNLLTQSMDALK